MPVDFMNFMVRNDQKDLPKTSLSSKQNKIRYTPKTKISRLQLIFTNGSNISTIFYCLEDPNCSSYSAGLPIFRDG